MDLDDLRAFLALVKAGSLAGACKDLSLVRSTIVRRIDALERRLGQKLVRYDSKGPILTDSGLRLAEEGPRVLAAAQVAEAAVLEDP